MARRNPNGYGSVTKLKGNRSRPYVIKVTTYDEDGHGRQVPVDYAATREEANIILARYNDNPWNIDRNRVTLAELYKRWLEVKAPKLGSSRLYTLKAAYKPQYTYSQQAIDFIVVELTKDPEHILDNIKTKK